RRDDAGLEVLPRFPRRYRMAPLCAALTVVGVRGTVHRDDVIVVRGRERTQRRLGATFHGRRDSTRAKRSGEHQLSDTSASSVPSSSSAIWCSRMIRNFTVPKSCRWYGVTPSARRALRWSIVGYPQLCSQP